MKTRVSAFALGAGLLLGVPVTGQAQVRFGIGISFPAPPPLVVVQPGIQVVPEYDEEIFFVDGFYWVCRDGVWYRTADWHGGWRQVRRGWVPTGLTRIPRGRYRYYYRDDDGLWRSHEASDYHAWREHHSYGERWAPMREHHNYQHARWEREYRYREHRGRYGEDRGPGDVREWRGYR